MKKAQNEVVKDVAAALPPPPDRTRALVFISHDNRDADLAEAFGNLLVDVSGGTLKSFRSTDKKGNDGIGFGVEWYSAIMTHLGEATDVVALLTQQSVNRPWILYEAGVAKGKLNTTVFGVALGVPLEQVSSGPFGQFQNCSDDEDSLTKLVTQLMRRNPDASPREEAVRMQVGLFRSKVKAILKSDGKLAASPQISTEQNVAKLFEEVKAMVRDLPERLDELTNFHASRRSSYTFDPRALDMIMHEGEDKEGGLSTSWLMVVSAVKDDLPWISGAGWEFYQALKGRKAEEIRKARLRMHEAISLAERVVGMVSDRDSKSMFILRRMHEWVEMAVKRNPIASRNRRPDLPLRGSD
jgi:hypothetical protein